MKRNSSALAFEGQSAAFLSAGLKHRPRSNQLKLARLEIHAAGEYQDQKDEKNQSDAAARIVAPASAVAPIRKRADDKQNEDNEEQGAHIDLPMLGNDDLLTTIRS